MTEESVTIERQRAIPTKVADGRVTPTQDITSFTVWLSSSSREMLPEALAQFRREGLGLNPTGIPAVPDLPAGDVRHEPASHSIEHRPTPTFVTNAVIVLAEIHLDELLARFRDECWSVLLICLNDANAMSALGKPRSHRDRTHNKRTGSNRTV